MDVPDDWKSLTRQLRKYAARSTIRDILIMDDSEGIYFRFPSNGDGHDCLCASGPATDGINPGLSLWELEVYILLCARNRDKVPLRDFENQGATPIPQCPAQQGPSSGSENATRTRTQCPLEGSEKG